MTILEAMEDARIYGPFFENRESWDGWRAFLAAVFGLPMDEAQQAKFLEHTGRSELPTEQAREVYMVVGRRGGKSRVAALLATYIACFRDYAPHLAPGERAWIPVIAADKDQAAVVFDYIHGFVTHIPLLRKLLARPPRKRDIEFINRVTIQVRTASFRTIRGRAMPAAICDEVAFWRNEKSANPDDEIISAITPGMVTMPNPLLICLSSPYARKGVLWKAYDRYYGKNDPKTLVWKASTFAMNGSADRALFERDMLEDESKATAEWLAEFRRDVETFVSRETVQAATVKDRKELPPRNDIIYTAFTDPSGGSQDSFTLAIAHLENRKAVLDRVFEKRPPFSPEATVQEIAAILKAYRCTSVRGDRYAGEWPREQFAKCGIGYRPSEEAKSALYLGFLPALNSGRVELLDDQRLFLQLCGLERFPSRSGRDVVDHGPGGHDDVANAVAGCMAALVGGISDGLAFFHFLERQAQATLAEKDPLDALGRIEKDAPQAGSVEALKAARMQRVIEMEERTRRRRA